MRWLRPSQLPVLVAWLVILGVLAWLGTHPEFVAPYASNLVSRHLLRIEGGGLRVRDFDVRMFEGMDLYGVSVTLPAESGGVTLISADTVRVDFDLSEALGSPPRLRRVTVSRPEVYSRAGRRQERPDDGRRHLGLPRLEIDHLEVRNAFLEFSDGDGRLAERVRDLDFAGAIRSDRDVHLLLRGVDADWETRGSLLGGLRGELLLADDGIHAERLTGTLNTHPLVVSGRKGWDSSVDIEVAAEGVNVTEVEDLIGMVISLKAEGDIEGLFRSLGDTLLYEGVFSGELEGFRMQELRGRALITTQEVLLQEMSGGINEAGFSGGGRVDLTDPDNVTFVLEGDVASVDLAKGLIPDEDEMPTTDGWGRVRIEHSDRPMWTRVTGMLRDGYIDTLPFDTCLVDVEAWTDSVVFNRLEIWEADLHALLTGAVDSTTVFRGSLSLGSDDLSTLPASWGWPSLAGRARGVGTVSGPVPRVDFDGWLDLRDFQLAGVAADHAEVALVVDDALDDALFTAGLDGEGLSIGGVPLGEFVLWGEASRHGADIDTFATVLGDTTVALSFDAAFTDSLHSFRVRALEVGLEGTDWALQEPTSFVLGDGYLALPGLEIVSEQGRLAAAGHYDRSGPVMGGLQFQDVDLGLLAPFVETQELLAGRLSANFAVDGTAAAPRISLIADLVESPFALARIDSLHVEAGYSEGAVDVHALRLLTPRLSVRGSGTVAHAGAAAREFWPGADLDLDLVFDECDWSFLDQFAIPALDRLAGTFSGAVRLAGTTDDPLIRGDIRSAPFHVHWLHLDQLEGQVWADRDALVLGGLEGRKDDLVLTGRIEIPMELDLLSEPVAPLDGPFYMQMELPEGTNLEPLARATNAFVQASGRGRASVVVSGPLDHPLYQGSLELEDAGFVIRNLEEIYQDVSCRGELRGDELILHDIEGREGLRGRFRGDGRVLFRGLELQTFDMRLNLERFLIASLPDLRVVVNSANARLKGVKVGPDSLLVPKFMGDMELVKARFTGSFNEAGGGVDPLAATVAPDWLADLHIHGEPRSARVVNREMELDLGGDLDLTRDENGLYLRGSLDVNAGRLIVFNNSFKVVRGRLDFSREIGFNPRMDVEAETGYRLRSQGSSNSVTETITVHVGGTLKQPVITFSSERGYSREAIQRMLLGFEPYATPEGDSGRLGSMGISAGFNVVEREIARELAIFDTFEIDQIQRQREAGDSAFDPLIGVGKYIGSDLYLKYAQGVRQDDRDVIVEYQINQHLLLQSEIRRRIDENQGQPTYNLDLMYRFEY